MEFFHREKEICWAIWSDLFHCFLEGLMAFFQKSQLLSQKYSGLILDILVLISDDAFLDQSPWVHISFS